MKKILLILLLLLVIQAVTKAQFRHTAVPVPLQDVQAVALCLSVTNQINFCHNCASES